MRLPFFEQLSLFHAMPPKQDEGKRHVHVGNRIVEYALRQAPRRRLSLNIDERGLRVNAPRTISIAGIESFIQENAEWVLKKLDEYTSKAPRQIAIRDGQRLPVLGGEIDIRIVTGANRIRWQPDALVLEARADADLEALTRRALQRRAHEMFSARIEYYGRHISRPIPPLSLSSARTRWGSCSATGIRLNWRLIHLPLHLIDYVVAHELAHLERMDHSPRFWAVVSRIYPDFKSARSELKQRAPDIPVI